MNIFLIAAVTVDGFIAVDEHQKATEWTTKADTAFFVSKTKEAGTIIMGRKTFDTFKRPLKDRRLIILTSDPASVAMEGVEATSESLNDLVIRLESEGVKSVAVSGGASIYRQFINSGLVTELYISILPKLFGIGVPLFDDLVDKDLELVSTTTLDDNNTLLIHYKVV
jgi:dihydrofolate reductase